MKLSEVKSILGSIEELNFILPNGSLVPKHFHITEIGLLTKDFIDCGGTIRHEKSISLQLWEANDYDHRLAPQKLSKIIDLAEKTLALENWDIEVEYQADTIGKYGLEFQNERFYLINKSTHCLASDSCGTTKPKIRLPLSGNQEQPNTCVPGGGCC